MFFTESNTVVTNISLPDSTAPLSRSSTMVSRDVHLSLLIAWILLTTTIIGIVTERGRKGER
jgi:hypothetical protein